VSPFDAHAIAEKIRYLITNPEEMKRMSQASRKIWHEKFSQQKMIKKIEDLYLEYA